MLSCIGTLPRDQLSQMLARYDLQLTFLSQSAVFFVEVDFKSTKHPNKRKQLYKGDSNHEAWFCFPEYYGGTALILDCLFAVAESWKYSFLLMTKNVKRK